MSNALNKFFFIKTGIDIQDEAPIFSPETYIIKDNNSEITLKNYLMPRLKVLGTFDLMYQDFSNVLGKPLVLDIVRRVGEIYYDADLSSNNVIGHFQGFLIKSSIPGLVNPEIVAKLSDVFNSELKHDLDSRIVACDLDESKLSDLASKVVSGEILPSPKHYEDAASFVAKGYPQELYPVNDVVNSTNLIDYVFDAKNRIEDPSIKNTDYFRFSYLGVSMPFYKWLSSVKVK
jgi:hypothetical protein